MNIQHQILNINYKSKMTEAKIKTSLYVKFVKDNEIWSLQYDFDYLIEHYDAFILVKDFLADHLKKYNDKVKYPINYCEPRLINSSIGMSSSGIVNVLYIYGTSYGEVSEHIIPPSIGFSGLPEKPIKLCKVHRISFYDICHDESTQQDSLVDLSTNIAYDICYDGRSKKYLLSEK
jgi:hypothetical protein